MKNKRIFIKFCCGMISLLFLSCQTPPITTGKDVASYDIKNVYEKPVMEFIGFKADVNFLSTSSTTKGQGQKVINILSPFDQWKAILNNPSLRQLGSVLQDKNIAIDQSFAYFGIYSLQELATYKGNSRYITFVEVAQNSFDVDDTGLNNNREVCGGLSVGLLIDGPLLLGLSSGMEDGRDVMAGLGVGCLVGGLIGAAVCAGIEIKTTTTFDGTYNIYIYDVEKKAVIRREVVSLHSVDEWKGSYGQENSNNSLIYKYYSDIISYNILKKYDELNAWLRTL